MFGVPIAVLLRFKFPALIAPDFFLRCVSLLQQQLCMYPVRKQQLYSFYAVSLKETIIYSDRTFVRLHKADLYKVQPIIDNKGKVKHTGRECHSRPVRLIFPLQQHLNNRGTCSEASSLHKNWKITNVNSNFHLADYIRTYYRRVLSRARKVKVWWVTVRKINANCKKYSRCVCLWITSPWVRCSMSLFS